MLYGLRLPLGGVDELPSLSYVPAACALCIHSRLLQSCLPGNRALTDLTGCPQQSSAVSAETMPTTASSATVRRLHIDGPDSRMAGKFMAYLRDPCFPTWETVAHNKIIQVTATWRDSGHTPSTRGRFLAVAEITRHMEEISNCFSIWHWFLSFFFRCVISAFRSCVWEAFTWSRGLGRQHLFTLNGDPYLPVGLPDRSVDYLSPIQYYLSFLPSLS